MGFNRAESVLVLKNMKKIIPITFISLLAATPVAIYQTNPFEVPTEKIRPRVFGHDIYRIPSKSMLPTLAPDDYIIVSNIAYSETLPQKGDIVVFNRVSKKDSSKMIPYIKRVIATSGDSFLIHKGVVFINGTPQTENYLNPNNVKRAYSLFQPKRIVPDKMVFVLGDNRDNSADSRIFGFVPVSDIIGQATRLVFGKNKRFWQDLTPKPSKN